MERGIFITFEGTDGSGKTTQIEILKTVLEKMGYNCIFTREPGGTLLGEELRKIILSKDFGNMLPETEAMLYAACRAQHVEEVIRPALKQGKVVLCDRYIDSSVAYQKYGRKLGSVVEKINEFAIHGTMPDKTFLLMLDPNKSKDRIVRELDRLESEPYEYHDRVYKGYEKIAEENPDRVVRIDGEKSIECIAEIIIEEVRKII